MHSRDGGSAPVIVIALASIGLLLSGCTGSGAADWVLSSSSPSAATASPSNSPTPVPTATATPTAKASASPSQTVTLTPTPAVVPSAAALGPDGCTGSADNKSFFKEAAHNLPFATYCAVLGSSWWLQDGKYEQPGGGHLYVYYRTGSGAALTLWEGSLCGARPSCAPAGTASGSASFGNLPGTLYVLPDGSYEVWVDPGTSRAYVAGGSGMTQSDFVSFTAALTGIVKS